MTTSCVIQNGNTTRQAACVHVRYVATAGDDTDNGTTIAVAELPVVTEVFGVQITSTGNVRRSPQGDVNVSGNLVGVNDSGLAVNEVITFTAVGYIA